MVNPIVLVMNTDFQWIVTKIDMKPDTTAVTLMLQATHSTQSRDDNN